MGLEQFYGYRKKTKQVVVAIGGQSLANKPP